MHTSFRFNQAVSKLYCAFHENTLHPECCKSCAVGNILDHKDSWKHLTETHGSTTLSYVGKVHQNLGRKFNGYSPIELLKIEQAFLTGCGYDGPLKKGCNKPKDPTDKDLLFDGLSAVIGLLCELDGVKNVMDCSVLFNYSATSKKLDGLLTF